MSSTKIPISPSYLTASRHLTWLAFIIRSVIEIFVYYFFSVFICISSTSYF